MSILSLPRLSRRCSRWRATRSWHARPIWTALGLEIIGGLVLSHGGTVQMEVSELGGLRVNVSFSCPLRAEPGAELPAGVTRGRADRPGSGHEDRSVPG